jgi:hypothetical protein
LIEMTSCEIAASWAFAAIVFASLAIS